MGNGYGYSVSFRVFHPDRRLHDISHALGVIPMHLGERGQQRRMRSGALLPYVEKQHYWSTRVISGRYDIRDLPSAIQLALNWIEPAKTLIHEIITSGGRAELFIGWFFENGNSGDVLDHRLIAQAADLGIDLSFDIYPDEQNISPGVLDSSPPELGCPR